MLKLLKTELEFEEQKLRMLTKSDGVFYEAYFIRAKPKLITLTNAVKVRILQKRNVMVNEAFSFIKKLTNFFYLSLIPFR